MLDSISLIINTFLVSLFNAFCWKKLQLKQENNTRNIHYAMIVFFSMLAMYISNYVFSQPIRLITIFILFIAINYFLVNKEIKKAIIQVIISQMILAFVETSFIIIASILIGDIIDTIIYKPILSILLNCYILITSCLISRSKLIHKIYLMFLENKNIKKNFETYIYPLIIIFIMIFATIESHIKISFTLVLIINSLLAVIFIAIIISSQNIKNKYNKINSKYETSISSLKEYEVMIDKFRVDTHENKNEFLTIRNMIKDNNDKDTVIKYIDKLVDNKIKDNDKIMKKTAKIPEGGLRATIYSKLCLMDKLKIKYNLNVSREVRTTDLINLDEDLVLKICKILGVFLDNAIEAVKGLKKKEISIEMYTIEDSLCIDITNNFKGNLELDKITNMKYTTKGDGHGYGLTLVNKLLEEEQSRLENEKSINRNTFTQTLKIKM